MSCASVHACCFKVSCCDGRHLELFCHSFSEVEIVVGNRMGFLLSQRRLLRAQLVQFFGCFLIILNLRSYANEYLDSNED